MPSAPTISQAGSVLQVRFDRFDIEAYETFIATKKLPEKQVSYDEETDAYTVTTHIRFANILGAEVVAPPAGNWAPSGFLFDYQSAIVSQVIAAERFAVFADCGLGKTPMGLETARAVLEVAGGKRLILAPKGALPEWLEQEEQFYDRSLMLRRISSRAELITWLSDGKPDLAIATQGLMAEGIIPEFRFLTLLIIDESSILKSGGGVIKWNIIHSSRGIPYKLSLTATPAPNDTMEFASQAGFLEKLRSEGEILWTFFTRDDRGEWGVKPHARKGFFGFMSGFSIFMRDPRVYGWGDNLKEIPEPVFFDHPVQPTRAQEMALSDVLADARQGLIASEARLGVKYRTKLAQAARGFLYGPAGTVQIESRKPQMVVDLALDEVRCGHQTIIWTAFDEEEAIIAKLLDRAGATYRILGGSTGDDDRSEIIHLFKTGAVPILISKPSVLGYGVNLQACRAMIFSGISDSYEQFYQAVRRAFRYGQAFALRVHIPFVPELEGPILENVLRKRDRFEEDAREMEIEYAAAYREVRLVA